ncbi:hypothetical protein RJT34_27396 [Clitoria ternatea]|uniref:Glutaredoxin domain-containing protein n=1 Tax=Clitoria ternatea TaxID=43366 RepID=A0AAN9I8I0_CLITE
MSRFAFFNRSNTIHSSKSESSQKPYLHNHQLDRSGSLSGFYGSMVSAKSSIRGKMVKKLCNLFESSKDSSNSKRLPACPEAESESESPKSRAKGSDSFTPFRLTGTEDRIVVYLTSLRGIRRTFEDCNAVRMILKGFRVWVDERDVSMDYAYREELQRVLGERHVSLPQVFVRGKFIGGADVIKNLFESGELGKVLEGFPKLKPGFVCESCGDVRFVPCENCSGSRKFFDEDEGLLKKCLECNENGLVRCPYCYVIVLLLDIVDSLFLAFSFTLLLFVQLRIGIQTVHLMLLHSKRFVIVTCAYENRKLKKEEGERTFMARQVKDFNDKRQVKDFFHRLLHYGGYNKMVDILVNLTALATEMGGLVSEGYVLTILASNDEAITKLTMDQLTEANFLRRLVRGSTSDAPFGNRTEIAACFFGG